MPKLTVQISLDVATDSSEITFSDVSGSYASNNVGGYGSPNEPISDIISANLLVTRPDDVTYVVPEFNAATAKDLANQVSDFDIEPTDLEYASKFNDGYYVFNYYVSFDTNTSISGSTTTIDIDHLYLPSINTTGKTLTATVHWDVMFVGYDAQGNGYVLENGTVEVDGAANETTVEAHPKDNDDYDHYRLYIRHASGDGGDFSSSASSYYSDATYGGNKWFYKEYTNAEYQALPDGDDSTEKKIYIDVHCESLPFVEDGDLDHDLDSALVSVTNGSKIVTLTENNDGDFTTLFDETDFIKIGSDIYVIDKDSTFNSGTLTLTTEYGGTTGYYQFYVTYHAENNLSVLHQSYSKFDKLIAKLPSKDCACRDAYLADLCSIDLMLQGAQFHFENENIDKYNEIVTFVNNYTVKDCRC